MSVESKVREFLESRKIDELKLSTYKRAGEEARHRASKAWSKADSAFQDTRPASTHTGNKHMAVVKKYEKISKNTDISRDRKIGRAVGEELLKSTTTEAYPGFGQNRETENASQGGSQKSGHQELMKGAGSDSALKAGAQTTLSPGSGPMDKTNPRQGDSQDASFEELDKDEPGKSASAKASETSKKPLGKGAGKAYGTTDVLDPTSAVNNSSSAGNVAREQIEGLFDGQELTEEFKNKAASLFEAVVAARVTSLTEEIETHVAKEAAEIIAEERAELVDRVDAYLNYVTEQWLEANKVSVVSGLKAEITEQFINDLREVFAKNYIEVPAEKFDVLADQEASIEELQTTMNSYVEENISLHAKLIEMKRATIIARIVEGLAATEIEKFTKLTEDVSFEDEATFKEKMAVLKTTYFPSEKKIASAINDIAGDETAEPKDTDSNMSVYTRTIKRSTGNSLV